jgi:hypothetical protein
VTGPATTRSAAAGRLGPFGGYWRTVVIGTLLVTTVGLHVLGGRDLAGIRAGVTLAFMAAGPGMAIMGLLRLDDLLLELSLALALSLVAETILAMIMVLIKDWSPSGGLIVLEIATAIGALAQIRQVHTLKRRTRYRQAAGG